MDEKDKSLKVKAISILKDNKKLEVEVGDTEGELRTLHFYKVTSEAKLKELAKAKMSTLKYTGFKGILHDFFRASGKP